MILVLCTSVLAFAPKQISLVTIGFSLVWIYLSARASREYVASVRRRLAARRLDIDSARVSVSDPATVALLEQTAGGENSRQAAYALGLLAETQDYEIGPLLGKLAKSPSVELRAKVWEVARQAGDATVLENALAEASDGYAAGSAPAVRAAVSYALAVSPQPESLLRELLSKRDAVIGQGVMDALAARSELAPDWLARNWIAQAGRDPDAARRSLAARAVGVTGKDHDGVLSRLLEDEDPQVVVAACAAAGELRDRRYLHPMLRSLGDVRLRGAAIEALASYGPAICGTLGDVLEDASGSQTVRRQVPRVLRLIVDQRSVDVLIQALSQSNLAIRGTVLKALNRLRESAPGLNYSDHFVTKQIHQEARYYFELHASLALFREEPRVSRAASLLARTIEERLRQTMERLFRLLGLCYPPREIYSAYLAVSRGESEQFSHALEFLDNVLQRDLKRVLLPLLDAPGDLTETGRHLFGIKMNTPEAAIRDLIRSADPWLAACAVAAAGELRMHRLAPEIEQAAESSAAEVAEVARSAAASLA
jgi:AAA family ATP:ADP antiporter